MDDALRNGLWSVLFTTAWQSLLQYTILAANKAQQRSCTRLCTDYFKYPIDRLQNSTEKLVRDYRQYFFQCPWYEAYDFVEFMANHYEFQSPATGEAFQAGCNFYLTREMSAYRFVSGKITRITDETEIDAIDKSLLIKNSAVSTHLRQALELLSSRDKPDYRNSVKESISAVESAVKKALNNNSGTLGDLLKEMEAKYSLHPSLKKSLSALYGYTSSADGIRHAIMEDPNLDFHDAKFMLVVCSAFVNHMTAKFQP